MLYSEGMVWELESNGFTEGKNKNPETDGFVYGVIARNICQNADQIQKILSIGDSTENQS